MDGADIRAGAHNLLVTCGGLRPGDRLLIIQEDPSFGYFDPHLGEAIETCALEMGVNVQKEFAPITSVAGGRTSDMLRKMETADRTLFLSRRGDQIRFNPDAANARPIVSYALDADMLASGFGWASHVGFVELKFAIDAMFSTAREIHVTCPLGTDFCGIAAIDPEGPIDVSVERFPMSVFAPISAKQFSGSVVQDGFLVGTGSRYYEPYACPLIDPVTIAFEDGAMTDFAGQQSDVDAARAHFQRVGDTFGLDPFVVHSWHAGIHPGCSYRMPAGANLQRWSGSAFSNPRLLHFHTCGAYAPGEISLNVLDPTIMVDGVAVWDKGVLSPEKVPGGADILVRHPCMQMVFQAPSREVGQNRDERLSAAVA